MGSGISKHNTAALEILSDFEEPEVHILREYVELFCNKFNEETFLHFFGDTPALRKIWQAFQDTSRPHLVPFLGNLKHVFYDSGIETITLLDRYCPVTTTCTETLRSELLLYYPRINEKYFESFSQNDSSIDSIMSNHIYRALFMKKINPEAMKGKLKNRGMMAPTLTHEPLLLDACSIWFLYQKLPFDSRFDDWDLVYSLERDGQSWAQFVSKITLKGPCILIMREKTDDGNGNVFGVYAGADFEVQPGFYGCMTTFIFTILPNFKAYKPTGWNINYAYLNHGTKTQINGLGFGGQMGFFGLFIDSTDFGKASCKGFPRCTTFNNPPLSSKEEFEFDALEVWSVARTKKEVPDSDESVFVKNPEVAQFLEMANKPMHHTEMDLKKKGEHV